MQTITVDMTPGFRQPTLYFSQNDVGREFVINLASRDGLTIPAGATVKIQATKPSGFGFSISGTVTDQTFTVVSTAEMTDEAGRFPAELEISASGVVIGTANFYMQGEMNPHPEGTTDGQAEQAIPELTLLVERIEAAADSIHELTVTAETLAPNTPASATYDEETNNIEFGIPRGAQLMAADDGSGNITLTFS